MTRSATNRLVSSENTCPTRQRLTAALSASDGGRLPAMTEVEQSWGDPSHREFERRFIRTLRWGQLEVRVHATVVEVFRDFFERVSLLWVDLDGPVFGWARAATDPRQALGLGIELPKLPANDLVRAAALSLGLEVEDTIVTFVGSPLDADRISRAVVELRTTASDSIENAVTEVYRPGTRALDIGSYGHDVRFLQLFLNASSDHGVYDDELAKLVTGFRTARGLPAGPADEAFWLAMFPERTVQVAPGDGGLWPRMVQALLLAGQYGSTPVTSHYGTRSTRDVRYLQEANGLRVTGFVRGPEWGVLVHRPVDGFPLG